MSNSIFNKNKPDWKYDDILNEIELFSDLYDDRPIKNNIGGMKFAHAFAFYFILKKTKPELVIESGVFKGQSTWLIEKTLPSAQLICLDIDLTKRVYISKKAHYSKIDFRFHDFSKIPENTLVLFDDHVNHIERIREANFFKIKNIVLEDNYPSKLGDFQTIKQSYENYSYTHELSIFSLFKTFFLFIKVLLKKIIKNNYNAGYALYLLRNRIRDHYLCDNEFNNINKIIETYYEFPPINVDKLNSEKPIIVKDSIKLKKYHSELIHYNHITYIKLK
jgi:hypothetical protein|tara:strand:- start:719 stop:1549 length:831 start_codon:yes stop_codon:yes gene_type:complete